MSDHEAMPLFFHQGIECSDGSGSAEDQALDEVEAWFLLNSPLERVFGEVLRQSIDEVLDGQRTGRYDPRVLEKTEKTYLGTKVEILCRTTFGFRRGQAMDFVVRGHEVDAKFSMNPFGWSIPKEADGHICLLMHADDSKNHFAVGLVRIGQEILNPGKNQDGKRTIARAHREKIRWLVKDGSLPENLLLELPDLIRGEIFNVPVSRRAGNGGQERVNRLFRLVKKRIIRRETVLTVAQQDDGPKRVRDARIHLRKEGILILGHQKEHPRISRDLGIATPKKGEWISIKVRPSEMTSAVYSTYINGIRYIEANPDEVPVPAPESY
jgi:hypothetical protein